MYVDITPTLELTQWPLAQLAEFFTTNAGVKMLVPQMQTHLDLIADILYGSFFNYNDFQFIISEFICEVDLLAFDVLNWVVSYSYIAFIREAKAILNQGMITGYYEPSSYVTALFDFGLCLGFFLLTSVYLLAYGMRSTYKTLGLSEGGMFMYAYMDEIEEECGQIEDGLTYLVYFAIFILWFYVFNMFAGHFIVKYLNWLLVVFCFVLILGVVIPTSVLSQVGVAFAQYIRGSGRSTSLIFETLLDFVAVSVIVIRFFVQNIRFVFIFVGFFEYYEFIVANEQPLYYLALPEITWEGYWAGNYSNLYWFEFLFQLFTQVILYLYYVGHLTITYIAQLAIFIILSFWIFFFLYTTFSLPSAEKFFFFKRYALLQTR